MHAFLKTNKQTSAAVSVLLALIARCILRLEMQMNGPLVYKRGQNNRTSTTGSELVECLNNNASVIYHLLRQARNLGAKASRGMEK